MNPELLEEVLACPRLPSLPAVAAQVIELTSDPSVDLEDLARTIQNDQALSAKILRTVNSSFYALRTRCSSISKALVLLGLGPVKSLALGFSLIAAVKSDESNGFDYQGYWRRALNSAVAAKVCAEVLQLECADEAFLGGLLQDIGMMALLEALQKDYIAAVHEAGQHSRLSRVELETFELQHADLGAMLCKRWKLPDELTLPVKYHERPTAAPTACLAIVRCVAVGNLVHDVLTDADRIEASRRLYDKGAAWLNLTPSQADEIITRTKELAAEMAELLDLDAEEYADPDAMVATADARLLEMTKERPGGVSVAAATKDSGSLVSSNAEFDAVTGLVGREGFEGALRKAFAVAQSSDEPLGLVVVQLDRSEALGASDDSLIDELATGLASLTLKHFEPAGGVVARAEPSVIAAVIPGLGRVAATALADVLRAECRKCSPYWTCDPVDPTPTVSLGLAAWEPETASVFRNADHLLTAATRAAQAAASAGGDCIRAFIPKSKAA